MPHERPLQRISQDGEMPPPYQRPMRPQPSPKHRPNAQKHCMRCQRPLPTGDIGQLCTVCRTLPTPKPQSPLMMGTETANRQLGIPLRLCVREGHCSAGIPRDWGKHGYEHTAHGNRADPG